MYRVCNISKEELADLIDQGMSTAQIAKRYGISRSSVCYNVRLYGLQHLYWFQSQPPIKLGPIDNKEKAYLLGFIIADSAIEKTNRVELKMAKADWKTCFFLANLMGCQVSYKAQTNLKSKQYPSVRFSRVISDILTFVGSRLKTDRNVPYIKRELEVYMVRGLFDADGCITWGRRKDRNRVWQKITFSSSFNILNALQKILLKIGIASSVKPKGKENAYVLEFANKADVLKFYDYLYADADFMPMERKFAKYNALRLELGEISETAKERNCRTTLSGATDLSVERAETTGGINGSLNDQISTQGSENELRYSPNRGR